MCTSFCPKCGGDFLNDGPVCLGCLKEQRLATIGRLVNHAPDDDGEVFVPATAEELSTAVARIEGSGEMTW